MEKKEEILELRKRTVVLMGLLADDEFDERRVQRELYTFDAISPICCEHSKLAPKQVVRQRYVRVDPCRWAARNSMQLYASLRSTIVQRNVYVLCTQRLGKRFNIRF